MCKLGYVPYTHKTWSQKFFRNTYLYIYISLYKLLSLKTKTDINRCLKWLMFHIQYIKLTKDQNSALQSPGLQNGHRWRLGIPLFRRKPPSIPQEELYFSVDPIWNHPIYEPWCWNMFAAYRVTNNKGGKCFFKYTSSGNHEWNHWDIF